MAETLSMLSIISFIIAGIAFVAVVFLWILFKIPRIIGDLSGRNARKTVAKVRSSNEKSGDKSYRSSGANAARVKLTSTMPQTQPEQHTEEMHPGNESMPETGLLADNKAALQNTAGTELLSDEDATVTLFDTDAATQLSEKQAAPDHPVQRKTLHILEEIVLIHTDEVIE